jgi:phosphopantetheinyl transferase
MCRTPAIIHFERVGTDGVWGLGWCEQPQKEIQYAAYLTRRERIQYALLKSEKRKREWLGARIALKKILEDIGLVVSPLDCETVKDGNGCPQMSIQQRDSSRFLPCSIAHKDGLAAVCVNLSPSAKCGIDIEAVTDKAWKIRKAFMNDADTLGCGARFQRKYSILWACKEAASKALGLGLLIDFKSLTVKGDTERGFTVTAVNENSVKGLYFFLGNFVVAICHQYFAPGLGAYSDYPKVPPYFNEQ